VDTIADASTVAVAVLLLFLSTLEAVVDARASVPVLATDIVDATTVLPLLILELSVVVTLGSVAFEIRTAVVMAMRVEARFCVVLVVVSNGARKTTLATVN
jgi:hypothetical protein